MSTKYAPEDIQAAFATVVVDEWVRAGVGHAVTCPGSRSTPLLVALAEAAERGALRLHVMIDERAGAFFALGLGLSSGVPAPFVTTSGTAAVEAHPAVVEAHHSGVPMVVVTADRPEELHDCGAPQTVHQVGLYGPALRWEADLAVPDLATAGSWRPVASRSVIEACGGARRPGPVHVNVAFREPLIGSPDAVLTRPQAPSALTVPDGLEDVRRGRPDGAPWHRLAQPDEVFPPPQVVEDLASAGEKGLIVAGPGAGSGDAVWALSKAAGWPVLASPTSGCRAQGAISAADALVRSPIVREWRPDVVLRLGAPWASRVLNEWLAGLECPQYLVDPWGTWAAPDRRPAQVVLASPAALCLAVAKAVTAHPSGLWARRWALSENLAQGAIDGSLFGEKALTEPGVARTVMRSVPRGGTVVVSSSMPIRDVEWWAPGRDGVRVLSNRGASGVDGVLSTALGVAASGTAPAVVALLGDIAFLYDAGVLARAAGLGVDLDVVVVDNNGGGIFNFLPQRNAQPPERFERLWGAPHNADLVSVARGYGVVATAVTELEALATAVAARADVPGVRVLVARTARHANVTVHRRLNSAVQAAVMGLAD